MADSKTSGLPVAGAIVGATDFLYLSQAGVDKKLPWDAIGVNDLSDAEEGAWTPAFNSTGTNPTLINTTMAGRYVKRGSLVTVSFDMNYEVTVAGSGNTRLGGLPFAVSPVGSWGGMVHWFRNVDAITTVITLVATGVIITPYVNDAAGKDWDGSVPMASFLVGAGGQFRGIVTYETT